MLKPLFIKTGILGKFAQKMVHGLLPKFNCKALIPKQWQMETFAAFSSRGERGQPALWSAAGLNGRQTIAEHHQRKLTNLAAASNEGNPEIA